MQRRFRNGPVLMELIIVILFFALSASVILQVFAAGYGQSGRTRRLDGALVTAQDWAERLSATDDMEQLLLDGGWQVQADGTLRLDVQQGVTLTAALSEERGDAGTLYRARIVAADGDEEAFTLPVANYVPGEVSRP